MRTFGIFVKHPLPGDVKTRLGAEIGYARSAELYAAFQLDLIARCSVIDAQKCLVYAPATGAAKEFFQQIAEPNYCLWQQPESGLGERLQQFFAEHLQEGFPVVVIGSDSPSLPVALIQQAFELLQEKDVVLGPAMDGGYYLVGQRVSVPEMFEGITWSETEVLQQTVRIIERSGRSLGLLAPWYDIDTLQDMRFLQGHLKALQCSNLVAHIPTHTLTMLDEILTHL